MAQAKTQLDTTQVLDTHIGVAQAQHEDAIAALIGKPPAAFSLPPSPLHLQPPSIEPGIPSELWQQRPNIAAAGGRTPRGRGERPDRRRQGGLLPIADVQCAVRFLGTNGQTWFGWPSLFWAVGTSIAQPLSDGDRLHPQSTQFRPAYGAAVTAYQQTTLNAFEGVEAPCHDDGSTSPAAGMTLSVKSVREQDVLIT